MQIGVTFRRRRLVLILLQYVIMLRQLKVWGIAIFLSMTMSWGQTRHIVLVGKDILTRTCFMSRLFSLGI